MQSIRPRAKLILDFNTLMAEIIGIFESKSRTEAEVSMMRRLQKRISLLISTLGDGAVLEAAHQPFIDYSEQILDPDVQQREAFFMEADVKSHCMKYQRVIDKADEFFFALVEAVRRHYTNSSQDERDEIYSKVTSMLTCSIEFKMLGGN